MTHKVIIRWRVGVTATMQSFHILVLDGDVSAAHVTQYGLRHAFGDLVYVTLAATAAAAYEICATQVVHLAIIDPAGSHHELHGLVQHLRREQPSIEVLVLASYDTPRVRRDMRALGVNHYLAKPVDLPTLTAEVRLLLQTSYA